MYRLNQADPAVANTVPDVNWLPLCYHFSFASLDGTLIYRVLSNSEIEIIAPLDARIDRDFPREGFPRSFPKRPIAFKEQPYDPTVREDALKLAAVFGIEQLSESEMKRAIAIAERTSGTISDCGFKDWLPEDILRRCHREPFMQGAPLKTCKNPNCTAEIVDRTEEMTIEIDNEIFREVTGLKSLTLEAHDVRRDSMRVFAIHQSKKGDDAVWPEVQLIFECCDACHCIRVTNQCD